VSFWDKAKETAENRLYELQHTEVNYFMFVSVFYFHFKQNSLHLWEVTLYLFWHMVCLNFILMHPSVSMIWVDEFSEKIIFSNPGCILDTNYFVIRVHISRSEHVPKSIHPYVYICFIRLHNTYHLNDNLVTTWIWYRGLTGMDILTSFILHYSTLSWRFASQISEKLYREDFFWDRWWVHHNLSKILQYNLK
jgi:hypothetical protein